MSGMTEAPFSLTFKMLDPQGVGNLITMRADSNELPEISSLLEDRDSLVNQMVENGWSPDTSGGGKSYQRNTSSNDDEQQSEGRSSRGSRYGGGNSGGSSSRGRSQSNNSSNDEEQDCNCGKPGVYKEGKKNGRTWRAIMCAKRNCDPKFLND